MSKEYIEKQKLLDDMGKNFGFETTYMRGVRVLKKIVDDLEKETDQRTDQQE